MLSVCANITQPNSPLQPLVSYSFNVRDLENFDEFKQGLYKYLRFTQTEDITNTIKGIFPAPEGKLNKAYPNLEFKPDDSYFYRGIQSYETEWPEHMLAQIPPGMTIQPKEKKRILVMKQKNDNNWEVLIF